jgi:trimeric autotransporter adhesin
MHRHGIRAMRSGTRQKNTACGTGALISNTTGINDSAFGYFALHLNTTGFQNTANGSGSLHYNTSGYWNSANGAFSLFSNTTGGYNTANGGHALYSNTTGFFNTAGGVFALYNNTAGGENTADGYAALYNNTTGNNNIGLGYFAGSNIRTGFNNIEIGGSGSRDESNTIRIGIQGTHTATYIAGIYGTGVSGATVEVTSGGRLGIPLSSARYERDIQPLNNNQGLWQLRPVSFRYKEDPAGQRQYGLVAEEVAKVYPELVIRDEKGMIMSVQYRELIPLMLSEMQHQQRELQRQEAELEVLKTENQTLRTALDQRNAALETRLERLEHASVVKTLASR